MSVEEVLFELKRKVQSKLPLDINVTGLEFEGPELVIYTDDPKRLADDGEIIRNLAKELRKRVVVRPDLKVLAEPESCHNQDPGGRAKRSSTHRLLLRW